MLADADRREFMKAPPLSLSQRFENAGLHQLLISRLIVSDPLLTIRAFIVTNLFFDSQIPAAG
jgi:hypothetical protein